MDCTILYISFGTLVLIFSLGIYLTINSENTAIKNNRDNKQEGSVDLKKFTFSFSFSTGITLIIISIIGCFFIGNIIFSSNCFSESKELPSQNYTENGIYLLVDLEDECMELTQDMVQIVQDKKPVDKLKCPQDFEDIRDYYFYTKEKKVKGYRIQNSDLYEEKNCKL